MDQQQKFCKIERIGIVLEIDGDRILLEVEGKPVNVPRSKTADALVLSDRVHWNGSLWVKKEEEEVKDR
ncbi:hypothetical protein SAMN05216378_1125 [Paenibacillus catalpae]|uniref:Uncharacterized protein n=1 Tax=Paenibacillus catalpae TaxID=1045775 RepID=A0A1I1UMP6_9BACL|nr:hypothetical protein [Paenibacillus catalpae]SFD71855.1 hypothetical protein SAMN05216378_1125 [Paenibacillus catalpae]